MRAIASHWPDKLLLPALAAAVETAAVTPLLFLIGLGMSLAKPTTMPWLPTLVVLGLVAFWSTRVFAARGMPLRAARAGSLLLWAIGTAIWLTLQYGGPPAFGNAARATIVFTIVLALVAWWRGLRYGSDPAPFLPEHLQQLTRWAWIALTIELLIVAIVHGSAADQALRSGRTAVPVAVICGLLLVAAGQIEQARRTAILRGGRAPGRGSWLAFAALTAILVALFAIVIGGVLGHDVWHILYVPIVTALSWLSVAVLYVVLGLALVVFLAISPLLWLIQFAANRFQPPKQKPAIANPPALGQLKENVTHHMSAHAALALRGGLLVIVAIIVAIVLLSALQRYRVQREDEDVDEDHESLWSRDLALGQLRRALHRQRQPKSGAAHLDLRREPTTVRDAYRYLSVLTARHGIGRQPNETASDFAARLRRQWSDVAAPLDDLTERYQRVRYGETADEPEQTAARKSWHAIWQRHPEDEAGGKPRR